MPGSVPLRQSSLLDTRVVLSRSGHRDTAERLSRWLLSNQVQIQAGPAAGGVVGWFDESSSFKFLYPEVTGYYLAFLAFLRREGWPAESIRNHALRSADWLGRQCGEEKPPPTRLYLDSAARTDWRNDFAFSFDLAMMWRGIAMAAGLLPPGAANAHLASIERHLSRFMTRDSELLASIPTGSAERGSQWAIHTGPFQMKSAAALLFSGSLVPARQRLSAEATLIQFRHYRAHESRPELLHHDLYFVEGAVMAGVATGERSYINQAATVLHRLALMYQAWYSDQRAVYSRSDVVAQLLRAGCLLHAAGFLPDTPWGEWLPQLALELWAYCGPQGVMYFRKDHKGRNEHINVWSGLFAMQALHWFSQWEESELSLDSAAWLV